MSNLTPAARVAAETIKAALESLNDGDHAAVLRALNVYVTAAKFERPPLFVIPPEFPLRYIEPVPAPPRNP